MSLRDTIKSAPISRGEVVHVKDWGVDVRVRPMSVRSRSAVYETGANDGEAVMEKLYPALIIASLVDPITDEYIFTAEDFDWLAEQPAHIIEPLAQKSMISSGLTKEAIESGKDGSSSIPNDGSTSS